MKGGLGLLMMKRTIGLNKQAITDAVSLLTAMEVTFTK